MRATPTLTSTLVHLTPEAFGFGRHATVRRYGRMSGLIPPGRERGIYSGLSDRLT